MAAVIYYLSDVCLVQPVPRTHSRTHARTRESRTADGLGRPKNIPRLEPSPTSSLYFA
jgi:hypothetical protein